MGHDLNLQLSSLLKTAGRFIDEEGEVIKAAVVDYAWRTDRDLIALLLRCEAVKAAFFEEIDGHWVFKAAEFVEYVGDKHFLADSYTAFRNRIGLTIGGKFLRERGEVALAWPYKDCVLEGSQNDEQERRKEIFFNETLARDEITRLYDPKVLTNWKRYTVDGEEPVCELRKNNEIWLDRIQAADSAKALLSLFDELMQWSFLKWYVNPRSPHTARETFIALGTEEDGFEKQKSLLCQLLDKNQLYVNASEMDDADFAIPDQDKALTREFLDKDQTDPTDQSDPTDRSDLLRGPKEATL